LLKQAYAPKSKESKFHHLQPSGCGLSILASASYAFVKPSFTTFNPPGAGIQVSPSFTTFNPPGASSFTTFNLRVRAYGRPPKRNWQNSDLEHVTHLGGAEPAPDLLLFGVVVQPEVEKLGGRHALEINPPAAGLDFRV
jgi:hypothetical protein